MKKAVYVSKHGNSGIRGSKEYIEVAMWLYEIRKRSVTQIAKVFNCHHSTIGRLLRENKILTLYNNKAKGERNFNWKGGKTKILEFIRFSPEYKLWRKKVFERDNYTCQNCGSKGGSLEADHIKPQSLFPELRLDLNNGRTLCKKCHRETETYGYKARLICADYLSGN